MAPRAFTEVNFGHDDFVSAESVWISVVYAIAIVYASLAFERHVVVVCVHAGFFFLNFQPTLTLVPHTTSSSTCIPTTLATTLTTTKGSFHSLTATPMA
jgi:hypothetical protein